MLTNEEYLKKDGLLCPKCQSAEIEGGEIGADGSQVWSEVTCQICHFTWRDVYVLSFYEEVDQMKAASGLEAR